MGYIYVISEKDNYSYFKIGFSKDPKKRLVALQTSNPREFILLKTFRGTKEDERKIHSELHDHKVKNEWFTNNEETRRCLKITELPQREFCEKELFVFASDLYQFMKVNHHKYIDIHTYCQIRRIPYDEDFIRKSCTTTGSNLYACKITHEQLCVVFGVDAPSFRDQMDIIIIT